jgi:hydrogenase expression/formation protein HypD
MKYLSEFRDAKLAHGILNDIIRSTSQPIVLMEICGGQTHAIVRGGLDQLLPSEIELVHGPGCPVCVTALEVVDQAITIASLPDIIFTTYGDMIRVPGSSKDLMTVRAEGGDVRVVYSPLDAVKLAQEHPNKQIVFFGIGFETTAPANAMSVVLADRLGLSNFSLLVSQVRVPPAMEMILRSSNNRVNAFLAAGHVCTVMGYWEYQPIAKKYRVPIIVTGFEPLDILLGIQQAVSYVALEKFETGNAYSRAVSLEGNVEAQKTIKDVFVECDRKWRGIGMIPNSGWGLGERFSKYDAQKRYQVGDIQTQESPLCIAGLILQGLKKPHECQAFAKSCTPNSPLGATMVSSEGACAAYYQYHRVDY